MLLGFAFLSSILQVFAVKKIINGETVVSVIEANLCISSAEGFLYKGKYFVAFKMWVNKETFINYVRDNFLGIFMPSVLKISPEFISFEYNR